MYPRNCHRSYSGISNNPALSRLLFLREVFIGVGKELHDRTARGQVATGYRTMIIASTKQVSCLLAVQINSSLKYQDSNNIFGDEVKKATFWSQNDFTASVFYLIFFCFVYIVCFASAESPLMEVQHHLGSPLFHWLHLPAFLPERWPSRTFPLWPLRVF